MNAFKKLLFPIALAGSIGIGVASEMMSGPLPEPSRLRSEFENPDTVIYPADNYILFCDHDSDCHQHY